MPSLQTMASVFITMMRIFSFPPIADEHSRILILGNMPGKVSLNREQYYAHPQNAFWKIMFMLFNQAPHDDYEKKKTLLLNHGIALWDVLKGCERESSADSDILLEERNDFDTFFARHSSIKHIFFNGNNPYLYYKRHLKNIPLPYTILPSTSPAHAVAWQMKFNEWQVIENYL